MREMTEKTEDKGTQIGKLLVIEGLDGSGKATQAELLETRLKDLGYKVRKISFPNYDSPSSSLVKMYLRGDFGSAPGDVNAYAASSFFAVDRYAGMKQDWGRFYSEGGILLADRYTTSNAVHQCCKLSREEWDVYLDWLFHFEYEQLGIPRPDGVIYLRMSLDISQKLMTQRYQGDDSRKDIHERDLEYLRKAHEAAEYCVKKYQWKPIDCFSYDKSCCLDRKLCLRDRHSIARDLFKIAEQILQE